jgi:hypothetical protein
VEEGLMNKLSFEEFCSSLEKIEEIIGDIRVISYYQVVYPYAKCHIRKDLSNNKEALDRMFEGCYNNAYLRALKQFEME